MWCKKVQRVMALLSKCSNTPLTSNLRLRRPEKFIFA